MSSKTTEHEHLVRLFIGRAREEHHRAMKYKVNDDRLDSWNNQMRTLYRERAGVWLSAARSVKIYAGTLRMEVLNRRYAKPKVGG